MVVNKRTAGHAARALLCFGLLALAAMSAQAKEDKQTRFLRVPTQFIAALGDPDATHGTGAQAWGMWRVDPGPRGVRLRNFEHLTAAGGVAPAKWRFDSKDWWLEENGLIMEKPEFPVAPGKYVVTGDRDVVSILTIHAPEKDGAQRWELADGAKLYDVTHLPCRSARYTPVGEGQACTPANAPIDAFRVTPGAPMPPVAGCHKQDYAVLFVIGLGVSD